MGKDKLPCHEDCEYYKFLSVYEAYQEVRIDGTVVTKARQVSDTGWKCLKNEHKFVPILTSANSKPNVTPPRSPAQAKQRTQLKKLEEAARIEGRPFCDKLHIYYLKNKLLDTSGSRRESTRYPKMVELVGKKGYVDLISKQKLPTVEDFQTVIKILISAIDKTKYFQGPPASYALKLYRIRCFTLYLICMQPKAIQEYFGIPVKSIENQLTIVMTAFRDELCSHILNNKLVISHEVVESILGRQQTSYANLLEYLSNWNITSKLSTYNTAIKVSLWKREIKLLIDACNEVLSGCGLSAQINSTQHVKINRIPPNHMDAAVIVTAIVNIKQAFLESSSVSGIMDILDAFRDRLATLDVQNKIKANAGRRIRVTSSVDWKDALTYSQFKKMWIGELYKC